MSNVKATERLSKTNAAFLLNSKPTAPINTKQPVSEKRITDPSATTPRGKSYPIPSFFEYRIKPKEYDSL